MNIQQTKYQIKQLKDQLKANNKTNDLLLLKLFVLMLVLAVAAALVHGRINFFV